jgi:fermentation-respiration switch protein FrsA (DUF1100 family)
MNETALPAVEQRSTKPRKSVTRWIGLAAACLGIFIVLRWFEHSQVFHPSRNMVPAGDMGHPCEEVWLKTSDGVRLNAWFFSAPTHSPRSRIAVLFCHGNAGNISHRGALYDLLLSTGVAVMSFDYRGYGKSEGRPTEEGTYRDAQAAYEWLRARGFAATNIIAFGESLGGGVAAELAVREKVGGLVLQSTFTSVPDIGAELFPWLPVRWLGTIRYDTHSKLPGIHVPVLVMHSRADDLIGVKHSERNFAAANDPKWYWEIYGGHNGGLDDRERFLQGIEQFLAKTQ